MLDVLKNPMLSDVLYVLAINRTKYVDSQMFGISPDGGSGLLELMLFIVPILTSSSKQVLFESSSIAFIIAKWYQ
jgi:hypothetical protein